MGHLLKLKCAHSSVLITPYDDAKAKFNTSCDETDYSVWRTLDILLCYYFRMPMPDELVTPSSLFLPLYLTPFSSLLSCVMENTANESHHCTVQYVYMYNCTCLSGPCPWCREYCYFPGLFLGKGRKVVDLPEDGQSKNRPFFLTTVCPKLLIRTFSGYKNNTDELHSVCRKQEGKKTIVEPNRRGENYS
jgi:hypothetical protein